MKISVYLPTKNRSKLLKRAVESVLNQEYKNLELIVVDDGSEDETPQMMAYFVKGDNRVTYLRNDKSVGAPASRNRAIKEAKGDFVTGLDDDDRFHTGRLSALVEYWGIQSKYNNNISGIYTQEVGEIDGVASGTSRKLSTVKFDDFPDNNQIGNQIFSPKSHYEAIGGFDESMPAWQDMELFIRMTKSFGPARLLDIPLYYIDNTPRTDRISSHEQRVRKACQLVIERHYPGRPRDHQKFWLQVFSPHYGFKPKFEDFQVFNKMGFWPGGLRKLIEAKTRAT
ncbi:glycosyltransferase [Asticcacaulis sp. DXS10W]|uniref:Glycosyltransferase n=1 Tax=Asticcacaulis currens TaxID=2984210 RepID=A0ABT5I9X6_9CAUL|nr:glycosyltransferase [Asticcacaulis currens]MDC7692788.1 glycosyltransferase [Asticcacaulis currens]